MNRLLRGTDEVNLSGKTVLALLIIGMLLQAGCGSNFEWFPKNGAFNNHSTGSSFVTKPGTVMREFTFPDAVKWVSDVAYDKSGESFWLLAWTSGSPPNAPNALVRISAVNGEFISPIVYNDSSWPYTMLDGSTLVLEGTSFWITSNGSDGGVAAREVYKIASNGIYWPLDAKSKYACPTSTGFCRGLAFDADTSSYWSAASDNAELVSYQLDTVASATTYSNSLFAGASDVAFDSLTNEVFVVNNGVIRVNKSSGAYLGSIPFTLPGTGRGDWDGSYFWVADNGSKSIKALFVR